MLSDLREDGKSTSDGSKKFEENNKEEHGAAVVRVREARKVSQTRNVQYLDILGVGIIYLPWINGCHAAKWDASLNPPC